MGPLRFTIFLEKPLGKLKPLICTCQNVDQKTKVSCNYGERGINWNGQFSIKSTKTTWNSYFFEDRQLRDQINSELRSDS